MTCTCARAARAALLYTAIHTHMSADRFTELYRFTKEHDMHLILAPTAGDIGTEEEEEEVLPTHTPVEVPEPAPSEPVPA